MGEPYYMSMIEKLYGVTFGNIEEKQKKEILMMLKQVLTKKEYKYFFASHDKSLAELAESAKIELSEMELMLKKARRKIKTDKLRNSILEVITVD